VPRGATVCSNNGINGRTPFAMTYTPTAEEQKSGYANPGPITAHWISGAEKTFVNTAFPLDHGKPYTLILQRPTGAKGLTTDAQYGLQVEQTEALQTQATTQREQLDFQRNQAAGDMIRNVNFYPHPNPNDYNVYVVTPRY
jgi:hypothetical protein